MTYRIFITSTALKMLGEIADRRIRERIRDVIDKFATDPDKQGKPLLGEMAGYEVSAQWDNDTESFTGSNEKR